MPNLGRLISVFEETRELIADPDNDFAWSAWAGREDALAELDGILSSLRCGVLPQSWSMEVLYAPTGPIQEVSLSAGGVKRSWRSPSDSIRQWRLRLMTRNFKRG
jgi:hypothetical protein